MKKIFLMAAALFLLQSSFAQKLLEAIEAKNHSAAEQLIKSGEKVNHVNENGQFPLWMAVWNSDTKMVELLLKHGADPNKGLITENGEITCLQIVAQEGLLDIARLMVSAGADVNKKGPMGFSPIRLAARNGHTPLVAYFISKGGNVDCLAEDQATPLEHAASKGHLAVVKLLVEKGANINHQDKEGDFPLGEAAKHGFTEVVKFLLSKGANVSLKNAEGQDAEEMANLAGQTQIRDIIRKHKNR